MLHGAAVNVELRVSFRYLALVVSHEGILLLQLIALLYRVNLLANVIVDNMLQSLPLNHLLIDKRGERNLNVLSYGVHLEFPTAFYLREWVRTFPPQYSPLRQVFVRLILQVYETSEGPWLRLMGC